MPYARSRYAVTPNVSPVIPFDDVLLPWALKHDPEVARIIQGVLAKMADTPQTPMPGAGIPSQTDPQPTSEEIPVPRRVTILPASQDGRNRRRRYASRAEQKKAYRERKALAATTQTSFTQVTPWPPAGQQQER